MKLYILNWRYENINQDRPGGAWWTKTFGTKDALDLFLARTGMERLKDSGVIAEMLKNEVDI